MNATRSPKSIIPLSAASAPGSIGFHVNLVSGVLHKCVTARYLANLAIFFPGS